MTSSLPLELLTQIPIDVYFEKRRFKWYWRILMFGAEINSGSSFKKEFAINDADKAYQYAKNLLKSST